ncbi:TPA: TIGR03757 family integrating conjugative element protein [Xanthomonas vasicola pv. zeae]|uniref:TIGR03757 family integrating conjugative element protein n=1 Tax=Xanthomonas TaxID=338 RepID=UPI000E3218CE|nr:TIGR03757 family integrating conjugative element protein [Xanthomonas vasicola]HHZ24867.1 TIGR03757 family integrating conjugative element protein [Xanthomonas vasicola pv. zeae]HHZ28971.1 TIGR03757 family integrating conjugative element protein [Xanthomonas vasicola pv. zeae]HHZ36855.1 TIGR03757 family integrating conjugative element protein [Xanthomonas vasicola pv. zeae]HHZ40831.1 TIGR03757 family integrating conjugative element protein [Xanthomonas vasicola pv. zeae]HHZ44829.1 TIGR03757
MRNLYIVFGHALFGLAMLVPGSSEAQEVWVISDSKHSVTGNATVDRRIELDKAQQLEIELSEQLPSDPQRAAALVQQRLERGGQALQQRLRSAYQDVTDAWSLGIATLPAVVVDQSYVVYGEPNLDKALARVAQYRRKTP